MLSLLSWDAVDKRKEGGGSHTPLSSGLTFSKKSVENFDASSHLHYIKKKKTKPTKIYRKRQAYTELAYLLCELNRKKHLIFPYISLCLPDEEGKANTRFPLGEQAIGTGPGFPQIPPDSL